MSPHQAGQIPKERVDLMKEQMNKLDFLMKKIDREIGYNFWKKYVASAFWSQISTPINLVITFLTAITTAQAQSPDMIPQTIYSQLAIVSLIITTLNTFFRPHAQFATNTEFLQKWNDLGVRFEKEYYDKIIVRLYNEDEFKFVKAKIAAYEKIQEDMNVLRKTEGANTVNFLTDCIFIVCYSTCIRNYKRWMDHDLKIAKDTEKQTRELKQKEARERIDQERLAVYERIEMARIHRDEQEEIKDRGLEYYIQPITQMTTGPLQRMAPPVEQVTPKLTPFDLFTDTPPASPPDTPPPPPPPQAAQQPPILSLSEIVEVRQKEN